MLNRLIAAVLKAFLMILDKVFFLARKKVVPLYPYDKRTKVITLPKEVERQLRRLVADGNKVEAVRQVTRLTGAGLRVSKDYVDSEWDLYKMYKLCGDWKTILIDFSPELIPACLGQNQCPQTQHNAGALLFPPHS
jgi:ribosomal protein L7/L12